jgi:hypothetical protein
MGCTIFTKYSKLQNKSSFFICLISIPISLFIHYKNVKVWFHYIPIEFVCEDPYRVYIVFPLDLFRCICLHCFSLSGILQIWTAHSEIIEINRVMKYLPLYVQWHTALFYGRHVSVAPNHHSASIRGGRQLIRRKEHSLYISRSNKQAV